MSKIVQRCPKRSKKYADVIYEWPLSDLHGIGPTAYREKYIEMLKAAPNDRTLHDPEKYNTATPNRERGLMGKANRMNIMVQNSDSTNDFSI